PRRSDAPRRSRGAPRLCAASSRVSTGPLSPPRRGEPQCTRWVEERLEIPPPPTYASAVASRVWLVGACIGLSALLRRRRLAAGPAGSKPESSDGAVPIASLDASSMTTARLLFTGRGSEYFRIWVVNVLLTVITAGIYSAWTKVRKAKYFAQNT